MESIYEMVDYLKENGFITKAEVEQAFLKVDRKHFVPESYKEYAYEDVALPLKENVTISAPSVIARSLELAELGEEKNVLEIGTGSGYSTALIKNIIKEGILYSIEIDEFAFNYAKEKLKNYKDIKLLKGDGKNIFIKEKFFDSIIVHAAFNNFCETWIKQLKDDGCIVGPFEKDDYMQFLVKYKNGIITYDLPVLYVKML